MKKNKGFTLIELLVVIAIIGILASVVLASLSTARLKAKIATVQSVISSVRAQAELGVDVNGKYTPKLCDIVNTANGAKGELGLLLYSIRPTASSKTTDLICATSAPSSSVWSTVNDSSATTVTSSTSPNKWGVQVKIDGTYYCADSTGFAGPIGSTGKITNSVYSCK